ncbi:MAG: RluA family pseudouridine synthase [Phytoplasma sp.]|uniref:RluA family pseudouridine synthase n=1 Tax=Phytoplasma sp. TaxID=2155 RepID=UPI002B40F069|nr:RluA family pseudouridine synthase [Phytoplasma sp.]WRH06886.1 MAG: RluA family pseudouridine synthase [Phytoplasma sp.]
MKILVVQDKDKNLRLDLFLTQKLNITRNHCYYLINSGEVLVNNNPVLKKSYLVKENDIIKVPIIQKKTLINVFEPINLNLKIIYEDQYLAIIDKPYDLIVHPSSSYSGITLINGLYYQIKDFNILDKDNDRPGIVHRLDKDTTGLIIIGKTEEAVSRLQNLIHQRSIKRTYWAIIEGYLGYDYGKIDLPIRRSVHNRLKMEVSVLGKSSVTYFQILKKFQDFSLLELNLDTGRTHQIRVHLSYLKHPIYGDRLYGKQQNLISRQLLHAKKLNFIHPFTSEKLQFDIPLPLHFQKFLDELQY